MGCSKSVVLKPPTELILPQTEQRIATEDDIKLLSFDSKSQSPPKTLALSVEFQNMKKTIETVELALNNPNYTLLTLSVRPTVAFKDSKLNELLSPSLKNLQSLSLTLSFYGVMDDTAISEFSTCLTNNLISLLSLSLDCSSGKTDLLTDQGAVIFFDALGKSKKLVSLSLNFPKCRKLTNVAFQAFGKKMPLSLNSLSLNFSDSGIGTVGFKSLCSPLNQMEYLTSLSLDFSNTGAEKISIRSLGDALGKRTRLTCLNLSFNNVLEKISDADFVVIAWAIRNLKSLESLSLEFGGCKSIQDGGLKELAVSIKSSKNSLKSLKLNFGNNKIGNIGVQEIARIIMDLSFLKNISLDFTENEDVNYLSIGELASVFMENQFPKNFIVEKIAIGTSDQNVVKELNAAIAKFTNRI